MSYDAQDRPRQQKLPRPNVSSAKAEKPWNKLWWNKDFWELHLKTMMGRKQTKEEQPQHWEECQEHLLPWTSKEESFQRKHTYNGGENNYRIKKWLLLGNRLECVVGKNYRFYKPFATI